jgi:hypothetical protein
LAVFSGAVSNRKPPKSQNDAAELLPLVDAADRMTAFFDSLGGDKSAAVSVYAVDPNNRNRRSFLFQLPDARELSGPELMAQVLEKYGAGEYMAESRDDVTGQIVFNPRFEVGGFQARRGVIPGPAAAAPATPAAKPGDISAELVAMMARQTAALEAMAAQRQPSMLSTLRELKELRDVIAPPAAAPQFDFGKVLELVTGVLDLRDKLGSEGGDPAGPLGILARSLAPALTRIAERAVDAPPALAPPASSSTAAGVTDSAAIETPPAGGDVRASNVMLKVYVSELVRFAEAGLDPAAATQRVLQTLAGFPESIQAAVVDWLNDEAAVENLAALEPKAAAYRPWLEQVIDGVLDAALEPAEAPAATPANGATQPAAG